jgi:hypothetical protein
MSRLSDRIGQDWRYRDEASAVAEGRHFRMLWTYADRPYGPAYFPTLAAAEEQRDKTIAEKAMPPSEVAAQKGGDGDAKMFCPHLEQYSDGEWRFVLDSNRTCVFDVDPKSRGRR